MNEFKALCKQYNESEKKLIDTFVLTAYDNDVNYVMSDETKEYLLQYVDTSNDVFF